MADIKFGEQALETVKQLETQLAYERADRALVQQQMVTERDRLRAEIRDCKMATDAEVSRVDELTDERDLLREQLADAESRIDAMWSDTQMDEAVAAERERCASRFQGVCTQVYCGGKPCGTCVICSTVAAIRREEGAPDGK